MENIVIFRNSFLSVMQTSNYLLVLSFSIAIGISQVVAQVPPPPQTAPLPETTIAIPGLQPQVAKNLADGAVGLAAATSIRDIVTSIEKAETKPSLVIIDSEPRDGS